MSDNDDKKPMLSGAPPNATEGPDGIMTYGYDILNRTLKSAADDKTSPVWCPVISVDDHLVEPPTLFDRVPRKHRDNVPKRCEVDGHWGWEFGGERRLVLAVDTGTGSDETVPAGSPEQYRPGVMDVHERVRDMDLNGMWASLNFPSILWGFAGTAFMKFSDRDLGIACVRAFNDWHIEEWCGAYPERFIPCQLPYMPDPVVTAQEIRRNAARGVHAISFSENPHNIGLPTLYTDFWDPVWEACVETETVINLHCGSSGRTSHPSPDSALASFAVLFPINAMEAAVEWIFAKIPLRYPSLRITLSEGAASWVPSLHERLGTAFRRPWEMNDWDFSGPHPQELFLRNFVFTSIEDPSAFRLLDVIGEDHVVVEVDYPHPDSTWPMTQGILRRDLAHLPTEAIHKVCFGNAARLYQHPLPPAGIFDSEMLPAIQEVG
jgi:predicted TIM-barrel fold metal-dependent hydrolase